MNRSVIDTSPPTYSLVIPVYCESQGIDPLVDSITVHLKSLIHQTEILIIDDGSIDDTWSRLKQLATRHSALKAVRLSRNFGKEYALAAGLQLAQGQAVIVMDGDLQHPPSLIPEMIQCWLDHPDVSIVEAVKQRRGQEHWLNRLGAKVFYYLLFRLSGYDLNGMSDFKLLDRKAINAWMGMDERNLFFRGMTSWMGFKRMQIQFSVAERAMGKTRWSLLGLVKLAVVGITSFSSIPLQLVTASGFVFLLFSLILASQALFLKLSGNAVDGFATVIILQLVIGSLIMISLGIIGIYIARIYDEVKRRPRYIISEISSSSARVYSSPENDF
jgi:polyisoprenyl-phosphate glycosyltransferase